MVFAPADKTSIAVLPFQNMTGDPQQEYFSDGMAEQLITGLWIGNSLTGGLPNFNAIQKNLES